MRKIKILGAAARKAKKTDKVSRAVRRIKMLKPFYKNRKQLAHVIKSVGQIVEKRL